MIIHSALLSSGRCALALSLFDRALALFSFFFRATIRILFCAPFSVQFPVLVFFCVWCLRSVCGVCMIILTPILVKHSRGESNVLVAGASVQYITRILLFCCNLTSEAGHRSARRSERGLLPESICTTRLLHEHARDASRRV